ncbi:MAG: cytochrome c3 family protein, partial [Candidatus Methanoperedens sp.]|nr:cytochrome c3 family protein [Candidatus Methanoperedens sp.]
MRKIVAAGKLHRIGSNKYIYLILSLYIILNVLAVYAVPVTDIHYNLRDNQTDCNLCHGKESLNYPPITIKNPVSTQNINIHSIGQNTAGSIAAANVAGNITLITSVGQNWYQQGIYGPNASGNISVDKSWGWTFFDENPPSDYFMPSDKTIQKNRIYALLLDSGNNSNPITGAQVNANVTYWLYNGTTYSNKTSQIPLIEDMDHRGLYVNNFTFYGGTTYYGYGMTWCDGCHLSYYTSAPDSEIGYFPGNYTVRINARANEKETISNLSFEVTPWGCEDCHGSGDQHRDNKVNFKFADMDSACYLCHGVNQIVHDTTDAGNPHQNTGHRSIPCTDCHTNKSINRLGFNGVTFTRGGINNAQLPIYDSVFTQLNGGTHENLTCIDCHNNLTLPTPPGNFKIDNYTIKNTINNFTGNFANIQEFQDYYVLNVTPTGSLNITLNWEGTANIGFYLYPPNFNPRNRSDPLNPGKGDYPYYNGSNGEIFIKPKYFANNTPQTGKWILEVYGYDLLNWIGTFKPSINYTINSTHPIQQKDLPAIPECNSCHNSNGIGNAYTTDSIPDWNPGFAHVDINNDGNFDIQCRMCHNAMHEITI